MFLCPLRPLKICRYGFGTPFVYIYMSISVWCIFPAHYNYYDESLSMLNQFFFVYRGKIVYCRVREGKTKNVQNHMYMANVWSEVLLFTLWRGSYLMHILNGKWHLHLSMWEQKCFSLNIGAQRDFLQLYFVGCIKLCLYQTRHQLNKLPFSKWIKFSTIFQKVNFKSSTILYKKETITIW